MLSDETADRSQAAFPPVIKHGAVVVHAIQIVGEYLACFGGISR